MMVPEYPRPTANVWGSVGSGRTRVCPGTGSQWFTTQLICMEGRWPSTRRRWVALGFRCGCRGDSSFHHGHKANREPARQGVRHCVAGLVAELLVLPCSGQRRHQLEDRESRAHRLGFAFLQQGATEAAAGVRRIDEEGADFGCIGAGIEIRLNTIHTLKASI